MTRYRINPGELRHYVTFQSKTKVQNDYGEEIDTWKNEFNSRIAIYPISGKEFFAAEKVNSEITHKVNMRYIPNQSVRPEMRILFNGRIVEIISVINFQERNIELQLLCKELF